MFYSKGSREQKSWDNFDHPTPFDQLFDSPRILQIARSYIHQEFLNIHVVLQS